MLRLIGDNQKIHGSKGRHGLHVNNDSYSDPRAAQSQNLGHHQSISQLFLGPEDNRAELNHVSEISNPDLSAIETVYVFSQRKQQKSVDAEPQVLKTYHESALYGKVPLTTKVQNTLRNGALGYSIHVAEFLGAFLSGFLYIWATYSYNNRAWIVHAQDIISVAFTIDYALRVYSEPVRLFYITSVGGIIDGLAVIPIITLFLRGESGGWTDALHLLQFLRILRIYPLLHKVGIRGTNLHQQLFLLLISMLGIVLIDAGLFHFVEYQYFLANKSSLNCDPRGCITFFQAFYFVWVTVSTVGYGDIAPNSDYGRAIAMLTVLMALIILPVQIQRMTTLAERRPYGGSFSVGKVAGSRYAIVSGSISYSTIENFLAEFYQSTHDKNLIAYIDNTHALRTIIMAPFRPSHRLTTLIAKYNGVVEFIEGSPLKEKDLDRVHARSACAFFLLADPSSTNAVLEDNTQIVRALTVHRYCSVSTRLIVEVLRPESEVSAVWDNLKGDNVQVVCLDRVRYSLLARCCIVSGLQTFISNLFMPEVELTGLPDDHFLMEYQRGFSNEAYPLLFPPPFVGHTFELVAEFMYTQQRVLLVALDSAGKSSRKIDLFPHGKVIQPTDVGIVFSDGLEDAFLLSMVGGASTACVCSFGWKCPCGLWKNGCHSLRSAVLPLSRHLLQLEAAWQTFLDSKSHLFSDLSLGGNYRPPSVLPKRSSGSPPPEAMASPAEVESEQEEVESRARQEPFPSCLSVATTVNHLLTWPPPGKHTRPYPAILLKNNAAILANLRACTMDLVKLEQQHVLICAEGELSSNLFYFVSTLRRHNVPQLPIVILHPYEVSSQQWGHLGMFDDVYMVQGSPLFDVDLIRAGVTNAARIVVLAKFGKPKEHTDDVDLNSSISNNSSAYDSDVHNIVILSNIDRLLPKGSRGKLIIEFQHPSSIRHLHPAIVLGKSNIGKTDWSRNRETILNFCPSYIEGRASCPFLLGFIQRALFYNANALKLVELLMSGTQGQLGEDREYFRECNGVEQMLVPQAFVGKPYIELFLSLLRLHRVLALGLYRAPGTLGFPVSYVYTNPTQDSIIGAGDLVYILR